ncbi:MAG: hypothetical protein IJN48_06565 [Clostridia bacterium]|nr:hypothetical protein [Clostridia bacterium]
MKKFVALSLAVIIIAVSLSACGANVKEVDAALQGSWSYSWYASLADTYCVSMYVFEDGYAGYAFVGANEYSYGGTYKIKGNTIVCTWDDGGTDVLKYSFKNGDLTIVDERDGSDPWVYERYE